MTIRNSARRLLFGEPQVGYAATTTTLHNKQESTSDLTIKTTTTEERLEDLLLAARDLPDQWVCERCVALHPVHTSDTPKRPQHTSCPLGWERLPYNIYGDASFTLSHRHIQLVFKYTRLNKWRYRRYLHNLLKEHHSYFTPNPRFDVLKGEFSAYPKVVGDRYLLLSTWSYWPGVEKVSKKGLGMVQICRHQAFTGDVSLVNRRLSHSTLIEKQPRSGPTAPDKALAWALDRAFDKENLTVKGSCPLCPTDFSVEVSPERALIRVWQDFGSGSSPLDPSWRIHVDDHRHDEGRMEDETTAAAHKAGSIREQFGHCMREALREAKYRRDACEPVTNIYIL